MLGGHLERCPRADRRQFTGTFGERDAGVVHSCTRRSPLQHRLRRALLRKFGGGRGGRTFAGAGPRVPAGAAHSSTLSTTTIFGLLACDADEITVWRSRTSMSSRRVVGRSGSTSATKDEPPVGARHQGPPGRGDAGLQTRRLRPVRRGHP
jgi:hypothetical protein